MTILWEAEELAAAAGAEGPGFAVSGVSIDTRTIAPGDLFVALRDARDGHDFVAEAFAKGAAGALVSRAVDVSGPVLHVDDTLAALTRLAAFSRARTGGRVVAVTGSVGKTTTKEMLRRALSASGTVHAADASFNNHIGVPLTLARMPRDADFAVLEIGMNHPGEIAPLAALARPDVAIVTNIERVHLGHMGSEEAIAHEKAAIFSGLAKGGAAVLPGDSRFFELLRKAVPSDARHLVFGGHDIRILKVLNGAESAEVTAVIAGRAVHFRLAAPGMHMAVNALAALTSVSALGLDVGVAASALDGFAAVSGRGARRGIAVPGGEALLLDESYNASGASIRAALAVLGLQPGRHVAVLGDILELGEAARDEHVGLSQALMDSADIVFTCGRMMQYLFDALPKSLRGGHAADAAALAPLVRAALRPRDAVLVKGSFGARMRDVVAVLEGGA